MYDQRVAEKIARDIRALGVHKGDIIMVHSSFKSLGYVPNGAETVIQGLLLAVESSGTLLMPALSYGQIPHEIHKSRETPSNVGAIPEYFRRCAGIRRSLHPTHSLCGKGKAVDELFRDHHLDRTPCGPNSPFNRMIDFGAKILMIGCGLKPNTTMHALEEYIVPPYLFGEECLYTITDWNGNTFRKTYTRHGFKGWEQRYDRIAQLPDTHFITVGRTLEAETFLLDAATLKSAVLARLKENPLFFVDCKRDR